MERLTRPDVDVTEYADKFLNTRLKGKEIDWKRTNDAGIDLLINAITCDEFSKDVFRQMARDLYGRLKQFEDTGLTPKEVTALRELFDYALKESKTLSEQLTLLKHIRELAAADKDGRVVVLPCKTVFELTWDAGPDCDLVCPVSIDGNGCCDFCDKGKLFAYERPCCQEHIERLGKTVFLTREEAEKVMKGETEK